MNKVIKLLWFLLFPTCNSFSQTCVIGKIIGDAIYVGADSRLRYTLSTAGEDDAISYDSICKIYSIGQFNFAVVGYASKQSIDCAMTACTTDTSFEDIINDYSTKFHSFLNKDIQAGEDVDFGKFPAFVASHQPVLSQIVFFGVQGDSLFMEEVYTTLTTNDFLFDVNFYSLVTNSYAGGHIEDILSQLDDPQTWIGDPREIIKSLIRKEISLHPEEVGEPIVVIKVTTKKTEYLDKGICN